MEQEIHSLSCHIETVEAELNEVQVQLQKANFEKNRLKELVQGEAKFESLDKVFDKLKNMVLLKK